MNIPINIANLMQFPAAPILSMDALTHFLNLSERNSVNFNNFISPIPPINPYLPLLYYLGYPFLQQPNSEVNESKINGSGRKRRIRTVFNESQLRELENRFKNQQYLSSSDRREIANALGLSEIQVKIWFQNRRAKEKKTRSKPSSHTSVENTTESKEG